MRMIFGRLRAEGLKFNAPKYSFSLRYISYLCYVIKMEGVNSDPKKVQGIMDIRR